jgi:hypothetical protein
MAEGGDVDDVGVRGMDADAGDGLGFAKPDMAPALPAVGGLLDAVLGDAPLKLNSRRL